MATDEHYKAKYADLRKKNTLKKAQSLQNTLCAMFPKRTAKEILHLLRQCAHHHYGQKGKPLSDDAKVMYEYLLLHNYNPLYSLQMVLDFCNRQAYTRRNSPE